MRSQRLVRSNCFRCRKETGGADDRSGRAAPIIPTRPRERDRDTDVRRGADPKTTSRRDRSRSDRGWGRERSSGLREGCVIATGQRRHRGRFGDDDGAGCRGRMHGARKGPRHPVPVTERRNPMPLAATGAACRRRRHAMDEGARASATRAIRRTRREGRQRCRPFFRIRADWVYPEAILACGPPVPSDRAGPCPTGHRPAMVETPFQRECPSANVPAPPAPANRPRGSNPARGIRRRRREPRRSGRAGLPAIPRATA